MKKRVPSFQFSVFSKRKLPLRCRLLGHAWKTTEDNSHYDMLLVVTERCTRCGAGRNHFFKPTGEHVHSGNPCHPAMVKGGAL